MTFPHPHLLDRALRDYLHYMNRSWLYVHFAIFPGPPPLAQPTNFSTDLLFTHLKRWPSKIRFILSFSEDEKNELSPNATRNESTQGYTPKQLQPMYELLTNYPSVRSATVAVQLEAVHASHSEYLLEKNVLSPLQDLLLRAPMELSENATEINFGRLIKICQKFGRARMLYDMSDELRAELTREPDYTLNRSGRMLVKESKLAVVFCLTVIMSCYR